MRPARPRNDFALAIKVTRGFGRHKEFVAAYKDLRRRKFDVKMSIQIARMQLAFEPTRKREVHAEV